MGGTIEVEVDGIPLTIDTAAATDWDTFELLCDIEAGEFHKLPAFGRAIFGKDRWPAVKDAYRNAHGGTLRTLEFTEFISKAFAKAGETAKN